MSLADKLIGLLSGLTDNQVRGWPHVQRDQFAALARKLADVADPPHQVPAPKEAVLARLGNGERSL
jgi:hypothetical protein